MLASRDSFLEPIQKTQLIQSQVARITLFTLEIQFLFDICNDESYLTLVKSFACILFMVLELFSSVLCYGICSGLLLINAGKLQKLSN